jgi:hypothetical protein
MPKYDIGTEKLETIWKGAIQILDRSPFLHFYKKNDTQVHVDKRR